MAVDSPAWRGSFLLLYAGLQLASRAAPADSTWTPLDRSDARGETRVVTTS